MITFNFIVQYIINFIVQYNFIKKNLYFHIAYFHIYILQQNLYLKCIKVLKCK